MDKDLYKDADYVKSTSANYYKVCISLHPRAWAIAKKLREEYKIRGKAFSLSGFFSEKLFELFPNEQNLTLEKEKTEKKLELINQHIEKLEIERKEKNKTNEDFL